MHCTIMVFKIQSQNTTGILGLLIIWYHKPRYSHSTFSSKKCQNYRSLYLSIYLCVWGKGVCVCVCVLDSVRVVWVVGTVRVGVGEGQWGFFFWNMQHVGFCLPWYVSSCPSVTWTHFVIGCIDSHMDIWKHHRSIHQRVLYSFQKQLYKCSCFIPVSDKCKNS